MFRRLSRSIVLATSLAALVISGSVLAVNTGDATQMSLQQWSEQFLAYIGVPAHLASDPRVEFLDHWGTVEGTFYLGNVFNPLDTEMPAPGATNWNRVGVKIYPTLLVGFDATLRTLQASFDAPILAGLHSPSSTLASLTAALARSNWTGWGPLSPDEAGYAASVGAVGPEGPLGPPAVTKAVPVNATAVRGQPSSTASPSKANGTNGTAYPTTDSAAPKESPSSTGTAVITGTITDTLGAPLARICVAAVGVDSGGFNSAMTGTDGAFRFRGIGLRPYRIVIDNCGPASRSTTVYYDANALPNHTTTSASLATMTHYRLRVRHGQVTGLDHVRAPIRFAKVVPALIWPAPAALTYGTPLSSTQLDASSPVAGTYSYSPLPGTLLSAGNRSLAVTFSPTDTEVYAPATTSVSLVVNRATPTLTWPVPAAITYGTALSQSQLDATASVPGTFSYQWPAAPGQVPDAGSRMISVNYSPTDSLDYTAATTSVALVVNPATSHVTWASPAAVLAGTTLSSAQLDAKSSASGTFTYSPPLGSQAATSPGSEVLSVTFTPTNTAYTSVTMSIALVVKQTTPHVSWPLPASVSPGSTLSATQLDASSPVSGTFSYSPPIGSQVVAVNGVEVLTATFTPTGAGYTAVTKSVILVVTRAETHLVWPTPASVTYGTALSATQLDATSPVPGTFSYSPPIGSQVAAAHGSEGLTVTFTPTDTSAATSATASVTLVVNRAVPVLSWPTPAAVLAGSVLSSAQLDASASVPGTFRYSPWSGSQVVAVNGAEVLAVTFTPTDSTDYSSVSSTVTLQIGTAPHS